MSAGTISRHKEGEAGRQTQTILARREEISGQLERILASPEFRNSKHYTALLRFVVQRALDGYSEPLKERLLGMEVFGRSADYDTNLDPVVRTSACEVPQAAHPVLSETGTGRRDADRPAGWIVLAGIPPPGDGAGGAGDRPAG